MERSASDRLWSAVIEGVRIPAPEWTTVALGLAAQPLRSVAARLCRGRLFKARRGELEAELVAGWVADLHTVDVTRPGILGRLWSSAYRRGQRWRYTTERELAQLSVDVGSVEVHAAQRSAPGGHPEQVLARGVRSGVLAAIDAELIAATRIAQHTVQETAQRLGLGYSTARRRRRDAEAAVVAWLNKERDSEVSDFS